MGVFRLEINAFESIERKNKLLLRVICLICVFTFTFTVLMEPVMQAEAFALSTALAWAFLGITSLVGVSGITYTAIQNQTSLTDHHFTFGNGNSGRLIDLQGQWYDNLTDTVKASVDKVVSILKNNDNKKIEITAENKNDVAVTIDSVREYWYDNFGVTDASQATSAAPVASHVGLYNFPVPSSLKTVIPSLPDNIAMGQNVLNGVYFPTCVSSTAYFYTVSDGVFHPNVALYSLEKEVDVNGNGSRIETVSDFGMYLSYCRSKGYNGAEIRFYESLGLDYVIRVGFEPEYETVTAFCDGQRVGYYQTPNGVHLVNLAFRSRGLACKGSGRSSCPGDDVLRLDFICTLSNDSSSWIRPYGAIKSQGFYLNFGYVCTCGVNYDLYYTTSSTTPTSYGAPITSAMPTHDFVNWVMQAWQSTNTADVIDGTSALVIEHEDASAKILEFVPATPPEGDGDDEENPEIPVVWFPELPKRQVNPSDPESETITVTDPNQFVFNDFAESFTQTETLDGYTSSPSGGVDEPEDLVTSLVPPASLGIASIWHYVTDTFSYVSSFFDSLAVIYHYVPRPIMYLAWADVVLVIVFGVYKRLIA